MRDVILALVLFLALPVAFRYPFVAIGGFAWVSLMNPHRLTWGFAYSLPFAQLYAIAALFSILFFEPRLLWDSFRRYWIPITYMLWMVVTTVFAVKSDQAWFRLGEVAKVHLMCLLSLAVLSDKRRLHWMILIVVGSIAFYGIKGGIYTLGTGGNGRVWGPMKSAIADNNHLAAALVTILPLIWWMASVAQKNWHRWLLYAAIGLVAISIFGSQSRGAFVAIVAIALSMAISDKNKIKTLLVVLLLGAASVSFMPDTYWQRIDTINTYEVDNSARGRLHTWKIAARIANARPTGAGFEYYGSDLYKRHADDPDDVHSSHSIYFQSIGEHGWVGFALFVLILASFGRNCRRLRLLSAEVGDDESERLARMMQVTLIGFAVSGLFVNIGNWDGFYFIYVILLAAVRIKISEVDALADAPEKPALTEQRAKKRPARRGGRYRHPGLS